MSHNSHGHMDDKSKLVATFFSKWLIRISMILTQQIEVMLIKKEKEIKKFRLN